jgi:hypothetical protein
MSEQLVEINAVLDGNKKHEKLEYLRVSSQLNIKTLRQILKTHLLPFYACADLGDYFAYQYKDKTKVFIKKSDGRLYSEGNNRDSQYQAYCLLRMLVKFGYVENYKRVQHRVNGLM